MASKSTPGTTRHVDERACTPTAVISSLLFCWLLFTLFTDSFYCLGFHSGLQSFEQLFLMFCYLNPWQRMEHFAKLLQQSFSPFSPLAGACAVASQAQYPCSKERFHPVNWSFCLCSYHLLFCNYTNKPVTPFYDYFFKQLSVFQPFIFLIMMPICPELVRAKAAKVICWLSDTPRDSTLTWTDGGQTLLTSNESLPALLPLVTHSAVHCFAFINVSWNCTFESHQSV